MNPRDTHLDGVELKKNIDELPEIAELDINPFIAGKNSVVAVDARIRVEK